MNYESNLEQFKFTKTEKEWLKSVKDYHSYFMMELAIDNTVKRVYLMDASKAPELTQEDVDTLNFERRLEDEGVEKVKINRKAFLKFWNKRTTLGLSGLHGVEYVTHRRYHKLYKCRPLGWILDEFEG